MKIALAALTSLACATALAQSDCKKERPLTRPELAFFERAKGSAKALPAAPRGWEQHPEEIAAPAKLCSDADPMFKKGAARLNVVAETEYRDTSDRTARMDAAAKAAQPSADETKRAVELSKKLAKTDGGAQLAQLHADQQKLAQAQLERGNKAIHEAGLDGEARIRISFNPESESSTGCGYQKSVSPSKVDGAVHAFVGTCDFSSNPQEPEGGVLLLLGAWTQTSDAMAITATPTYDPKKPHTAVQAISVLITGDGPRPEELLKAIDVKALGALIK